MKISTEAEAKEAMRRMLAELDHSYVSIEDGVVDGLCDSDLLAAIVEWCGWEPAPRPTLGHLLASKGGGG